MRHTIVELNCITLYPIEASLVFNLDSPASTKTVAIFIYLLLSTIAELRAMVMDKLLKNAANAEQLIVGLKQRLASLQSAIGKGV